MLAKLQKNKLLMVLVSVFLSFAIVLCVFTVSARPVHAVAIADDVIYLIIATVCLSLAINVAVDSPDWSSICQPIYDSLSEQSQRFLASAATAGYLGYSYVYEWAPEQYAQLTTEIIDYFRANSFDTVVGTVTPSHSSGKIGFLSGYTFSLHYPAGTDSCCYYFPSGTFTIYDVYNKNAFPACAARDVATAVQRGYIITNSDGFGFCQANSSVYSWSDCTFTPYLYNNNAHEYDNLIPSNNSFSVFNIGSTSVPNNSPSEFSFYFDSLGNIYRIYSPDNRTHYFLDINSGSYYQNLSFPSRLALVDWFRDSLGLVTYTYGVDGSDSYHTPVSDTGFDFDEDEATAAQTTILSNAESSGVVTTVLPGSEADLNILVDNPTAVTDVSEAQQLMNVVSDTNDTVSLGFSSISDLLSSVVDFVSNFWDNLLGLFIPPPEFWETDFFAPIRVSLENKFTWLAGLQNWLELFRNTEGQSLFYQTEFMGYVITIDFSWFAPYRLNIRSLFSVIFGVLCCLKCLKLLTSAFNVDLTGSVSSPPGLPAYPALPGGD